MRIPDKIRNDPAAFRAWVHSRQVELEMEAREVLHVVLEAEIEAHARWSRS